MTRDELAVLVGVDPGEVGRWQRLGLVAADEPYGSIDLVHARLIAFAARRGTPPEELARILAKSGDTLDHFARWASPGRSSPG